MEMRKVQVTGGGSSYIITLPKKWVLDHKIEKNDQVGLIEQPDGTLVITTRKGGEPNYKVKHLDITDISNPAYLFRLLIGLYIMGFSIIEITSKTRLSPDLRESILHFSQITIGPEVMDETINSMTIKDLIDPTEMPFDKTINRMFMLVKAMHEDAITALLKKDKKLAKEVITRDHNVNRLNWLIARQTNLVLRDTLLSKEMNITSEEAIYYLLVSRIIERIGDHAVRIAENGQILLEQGLENEIIENINSASRWALNMLVSSMEALIKKDLNQVNATIELIGELIESCKTIHHNAVQLVGEISIAVSYIIESIQRTGEYAIDIAEATINHLINIGI